MQTAMAVAATARSRRRGQAAQTPGTMDPSRCLRLPHSALGAPDAPHRPGWSMTMASRASCRKPRLTHGRQPWPRRRARGPAAPPALAQHRSTHKACHYSSNFLTIHPHNGILPFLLIKLVDSPKKGRPLLAPPLLRMDWRTAKLSTTTEAMRATAATALPPAPTTTPSTAPPARHPDAPLALRSTLGLDSNPPPPPPHCHSPTSHLIWQRDFQLCQPPDVHGSFVF